MKKRELDHFKKLLHEERKKILHHLEDLSGSSGEELELGTGDSVDIASIEISQSSLQKIGKRELYLLKKIDYALKKIDAGHYGECESCGEPIAVARLNARPVAQLCIDCKTEQESVERRYRGNESEEEEGADDAEFEGGED